MEVTKGDVYVYRMICDIRGWVMEFLKTQQDVEILFDTWRPVLNCTYVRKWTCLNLFKEKEGMSALTMSTPLGSMDICARYTPAEFVQSTWSHLISRIRERYQCSVVCKYEICDSYIVLEKHERVPTKNEWLGTECFCEMDQPTVDRKWSQLEKLFKCNKHLRTYGVFYRP